MKNGLILLPIKIFFEGKKMLTKAKSIHKEVICNRGKLPEGGGGTSKYTYNNKEPEIKLPTSVGSSKKQEFQKNIYFCFIDYAKAFDCVDHNKLENS